MKTNTKISILAFVLLCGSFLFIGCGIYTQISVTADNSVNLSDYKTFAWLPDSANTTNSPYNNEIIRNNLKNYFGQSFVLRGFVFNNETPDVLFQIVITNKNREHEIIYPPQTNPYYVCNYYYCSLYYSPNPYDYYYRNSSVFCYINGNCSRKIEYVEGSIILNMIDRKHNKLIWSGTAKGDIYDPSYINNDIHPAALRIMEKFPIHVIKNKVNTIEQDKVYNFKNTNAKK